MNIPVYLIIILAVIALVVAFHLAVAAQLSTLRRSGLYPEAGKASMADVERLLSRGLPTLAMRCYREVHGCGLRQAKEALAAMAASKQPADGN